MVVQRCPVDANVSINFISTSCYGILTKFCFGKTSYKFVYQFFLKYTKGLYSNSVVFTVTYWLKMRSGAKYK